MTKETDIFFITSSDGLPVGNAHKEMIKLWMLDVTRLHRVRALIYFSTLEANANAKMNISALVEFVTTVDRKSDDSQVASPSPYTPRLSPVSHSVM